MGGAGREGGEGERGEEMDRSAPPAWPTKTINMDSPVTHLGPNFAPHNHSSADREHGHLHEVLERDLAEQIRAIRKGRPHGRLEDLHELRRVPRRLQLLRPEGSHELAKLERLFRDVAGRRQRVLLHALEPPVVLAIECCGARGRVVEEAAKR